MRTFATVLFLACVASLCAPLLAKGEEPCRYAENRTAILCSLDAFTTIKNRCVGFETEAKVCATQFTLAEQGRVEANEGLRKCVASIPPPPPPRSMLKPRTSFALTLVGSLLLGAGVMSNGDAMNRAAFAGTGLLSIAAGAWLMETQ